MPVWICWPSGPVTHSVHCGRFTIEDVYHRSWTCCLMQDDESDGSEIDDSDGVELDRLAIAGGSDIVIVSAADEEDLAELLARGVRLVGFPLPLTQTVEQHGRWPAPSEN